MAYLSPEDARATLIQSGRYTDATAPDLVTLELAIANLEALVNEWLGRDSMEVKEYVEILQSNREGLVRLKHKPLIKVKDVRRYLTHIPGPNKAVSAPSHTLSGWRVNQGIVVTGLAYTSIEVVYDAGYDPLPAVVPMAMKMLLLKNDDLSGGNLLSFDELFDSKQTVSSISLPGGLSKSFAPSQSTATGGKGDGTELDKALTPLLSRYRLNLKFV